MALTGGTTAAGSPCRPTGCGAEKGRQELLRGRLEGHAGAAGAEEGDCSVSSICFDEVEMLEAMGFEQAACLKALEVTAKI